MPAEETIDWSLCPLVEVNPRVLSGAPVLCGTRMPVNAFSWVLNEETTKTADCVGEEKGDTSIEVRKGTFLTRLDTPKTFPLTI